jgi:hypothetical protein
MNIDASIITRRDGATRLVDVAMRCSMRLRAAMHHDGVMQGHPLRAAPSKARRAADTIGEDGRMRRSMRIVIVASHAPACRVTNRATSRIGIAMRAFDAREHCMMGCDDAMREGR